MNGEPPAVVLVDPKYAPNVGRALRNCSAFGIGQLWVAGDRWAGGLTGKRGGRLPREERMKGYQAVEMIRDPWPLRQFQTGTPVAVEVMPQAEQLTYFEFPEDPVFVFGPEDGSLPDWARRNCHRHVIIPTRHCVNLADAVGMVLVTWHMRKIQLGAEPARPSYAMLDEIRGQIDTDELFAV